MTEISFALQLHSIRNECVADLPRALRLVAAMGYQGVEFAGYYGYPAPYLRRLLDGLGLQAVGTSTWFQHVPLVGSGAETDIARAVAYNRVLGNSLLIGIGDVPFAAKERARIAGWIERAEMHNALARQLASKGMRVGYHNHALEFSEVVEGERVWDILISHLDESVLIELDTGSAFRGGGDVLSTLEQCAGRVKTVHLKPYSRTKGTRALIGEDDLPWSEILHLCQTVAGTEWYVVEYESDSHPRMAAVRRCLDALKALVG
jgi:sugar phosphate isomerase/epimerase